MKHRQFHSSTLWPAAATLLAALLLIACSDGSAPKPAFLSTDITNANFGADFDLVDQTGKMRTLADFKGKAVVVFLAIPIAPMYVPPRWANSPLR